ncbi:dihydroneopterin aldolase [Ferroacidibacillus organovorans]|uniref:7,8-dihydroneopterin aldolase n=1 Tax=Ferroacidibacillus organovorans TaxID=1765683 RepID=A0A101XPB7_9BACL|nr:dihydroneopterin aldolase [Ferroacidibacillus organovorans]KUO95098.1 hypothetical protein ATW55_11530 [Ferroacidibacillus organovorans]
MDCIIMEELAFFGRHGVYEEETKLGQRFVVTLHLYGDFQKAAAFDDVALTVDYGKVYEVVKQIVEGPPVKLVETVAQRIAQAILESFSRILTVTVRLEKPGAPIQGVFGTVGVEMTRSQIES